MIRNEKKFNCQSCGNCCQNISKVEKLRKFNLGNGICKFLFNNKCLIYHKRPVVCNVNEIYIKIFKKIMSKQKFYEENKKICIYLNEKIKKG